MTITCNFQGRLGNLLYEIATVLATAWRQNLTPAFCLEHERGYYNDQPSYRDYVKHIISQFHCFQVTPNFKYHDENIRLEPSMPILTEDTMLRGYFNSYEYFEDYRERIIDLFTKRDKEQVESRYQEVRRKYSKPLVAVHVRRADYVTDYGWALGVDYYERAYEEIRKRLADCTFVIFSDDRNWCIEHLRFMQSKEFPVDKDYIEMQLMGRFDGLIMANSTFSDWGGKLGRQKLVIAPDVWRDDKGGADPYNKWIYEPHWIRL